MIRLENVSKSYAGKPVLQGLSLELAAGGCLAVLGPSGCGKTTLLRIIAGLELPDAGEVFLNGQLASRPGWGSPPYTRSIGFAFQSPALWPHMSVAQNVGFALSHLPRAAKKQRLAEALEKAGLSNLAGRYPPQLSGGEARRAALARALAPRPQILLLDEPLVHLDPEARRQMLAWVLAETTRQALTVIWVTHNPEELDGFPAQRCRMQAGKVFDSGVEAT